MQARGWVWDDMNQPKTKAFSYDQRHIYVMCFAKLAWFLVVGTSNSFTVELGYDSCSVSSIMTCTHRHVIVLFKIKCNKNR